MLGAKRPTLRAGPLHVRVRPTAAGRRVLLAKGGAGVRVVVTASDAGARARAVRALPVRTAR